MINTIEAQNSGYRFMPGVSQYSCGVAALPGFALERVRFADPVPLRAGFARIAEIMKSAGRPLTAFAACELRSPAPFTEEGFKAFNEIYIKTLIEWGMMKDGVNPVARSNVCPKIDPPAEPCFYAFSYAATAPGAPTSFVIAGSGESVGRQGELPRPYRGTRRHQPGGHAGESKMGARRNGAPHERVWRHLESDHRRAALYRARRLCGLSKANSVAAAYFAMG